MTRVPFEAMRGQGQSVDATIDKQRCLGSALTIGMKIASKFTGRFTYWHFDANAGSGHNDMANVPGSPIVFHTIADACLNGMRRQAFFCDCNSEALKHLGSRLGGWAMSSKLMWGDNEDHLATFAQYIGSTENPMFAVGSVIVDPNGYWYRNGGGLGAPTNALPIFARNFPRIDIILNLNLRTYWMQRAHGHAVLLPRDVLARFHKDFWLVRYNKVGNGRFLLAVGRNVETGDHRKLGFHKLDSPEGHDAMTSAEGGRQHDLAV
jgi:hypothetical protein